MLLETHTTTLNYTFVINPKKQKTFCFTCEFILLILLQESREREKRGEREKRKSIVTPATQIDAGAAQHRRG